MMVICRSVTERQRNCRTGLFLHGAMAKIAQLGFALERQSGPDPQLGRCIEARP